MKKIIFILTMFLVPSIVMANEIKDTKYINVGKEPFLIKESDFDKYMKYGGGFRVVRFVGNMETDWIAIQ